MTNQEINDDPVSYHLCVLRKMLSTLPESIQRNLCSQLDQFLDSLSTKEAAFLSSISSDLHDVQVLMAAMQFDLEATKSERDFYKRKAGE